MKPVKLNIIADGAIDLLSFFSAVLLVFIAVAVTYEVIVRYLLSRPTTWVIEITEYSLLFIVFLGMPWVLKEDRHVKVDLILMLLPARVKTVLNIVTSVLGALVALALCWYGGRVSWDVFIKDYYQFGVMKIPYVYIISVVPLGGLMLFVQFLRKICICLYKLRHMKNGTKITSAVNIS